VVRDIANHDGGGSCQSDDDERDADGRSFHAVRCIDRGVLPKFGNRKMNMSWLDPETKDLNNLAFRIIEEES